MSVEQADCLEALGRDVSEDGAAAAVFQLTAALQSSSPMVREGAVYGLAQVARRFPAWVPDVVRALGSVANADLSPGLREAASECLEDLQ